MAGSWKTRPGRRDLIQVMPPPRAAVQNACIGRPGRAGRRPPAALLHIPKESTFMKHYFVAALLAVGSVAVHAADCAITVESNDAMQFDKKEIVAPKSCKTFNVQLKHVGKLPKAAMGHNWVLTKTADVQAVANDGIPAGLNAQYLKAGDARVIAHTKVIGGGETDSVAVDMSKLKAGESYTFFCSFPGHSGIMKGTFKIGS